MKQESGEFKPQIVELEGGEKKRRKGLSLPEGVKSVVIPDLFQKSADQKAWEAKEDLDPIEVQAHLGLS
ncbi:hypothetical protein HYU95_04090 [Candidatus Daviesbacteria bacterium]|nr:hypothetical protein [Candidatus Daviesbacteria bacterium]